MLAPLLLSRNSRGAVDAAHLPGDHLVLVELCFFLLDPTRCVRARTPITGGSPK